MKKSSIYLYLVCLFLIIAGAVSGNRLQAQSFFGFQTIGVNTFFFSVGWQGEPVLGFGYNFRDFNKSFTDISAELRFPIKDMYTFDNYEFITGFYGPVAIKKAFFGFGTHLRLQKQSEGDRKNTRLSLAVTGMPSYAYLRNLNDGAYSTAGLRVTYAPVIVASSKEGGADARIQAFPVHKFELGAHLDLHLERTLGLGLNVFSTYSLLPKNSILDDNRSMDLEGNLYMGATYHLKR
jgi:hypothetical protein